MFFSATKIFASLILAAFIFAGSSGIGICQASANNLKSAIAQFEALKQDSKRGMLREPWEKLEKSFQDIEARQPELAAVAMFYQASTREELARRSANRSDYIQAVSLYEKMHAKFSSHALAEQACYNSAAICFEPLGDYANASIKIEHLLSKYPNSKLHGEAKSLQGRLRQKQIIPDAGTQSRQSELYSAAAVEWRKMLAANTTQSQQRDNWLQLESRFQKALEISPQGNDAHKAAFQVARCREELARRSTRKDDWEKALSLFEVVLGNYPSSNLADDSLYHQADILANRLSRKDEAVKKAERILREYPAGDMIVETKKLLVKLGHPVNTGSATAGGQTAPPVTASVSVKGFIGDNKLQHTGNTAILRSISWAGAKDNFEIVFEFAGKAKYLRKTLPAGKGGTPPVRAQFDFLDTQLAPQLKNQLKFIDLPLGRIGFTQGQNSRVVLELGTARSYKTTVLYNPYRIKVEVNGASVLQGGEDLLSLQQSAGVSNTSGAARVGAPSPEIMSQLGLNIKTIMIDAGHGGRDPGAHGNGIIESVYTLELAKLLGARLKAKGFKVIYTRESNIYLALEDRTNLANNQKADIFLSLHVNSNKNANINGLETYYLDVARSDAAALVAARENAVTVNTTSDLQFILSDLTRNSKRDESRALAQNIQKNILSQLRAGGFKTKDNGVRSAPFYVLMGARMPSVLIEVGYLSNSSDLLRLKNKAYMLRLADGIANGVTSYHKQLHNAVP